MKTHIIYFNTKSEKYIPPEIICDNPLLSKKDREIIALIGQNNFRYVVSGKILYEANKTNVPFTFYEDEVSLTYSTSDVILEEKIRELLEENL